MATPSEKRPQYPKDANGIKNLLKEMGITEYEPALINLVLDYAYKYVTDVLEDAKIYSQHAQKRNIDLEDVKFVILNNMNHEVKNPPSIEVLDELAVFKNMNPLPPIKPYAGLRLPPDRYCLLAPNYQLKSLTKPHSTGIVSNNINIHNFTNIRQPYINNNIVPGSLSQNIQFLSRTGSFQQRGLLQAQNQRPSINLHSINTNAVNPRFNLLRQNSQFIQQPYTVANQSINTIINKNN